MSEEQIEASRHKGIYLLPNLFTTGSLFSGFYAIIAAMNHQYVSAAVAIFIALIFDGLDGRVARLINAQSPFGAEYDSLSDMLSFGITPALVIYNFALEPLGREGFGKLGWLSAFLFVACVALRLARFNTQVDHSGLAKRYFSGLPCPAAAGFMASMVWLGSIYQLSSIAISLVAAVITVLVSLLMVSNVPFRSFKDIDLKGRVPFAVLVSMVAVYIAISISPAHLLFGLTLGYILSGPLAWGWQFMRQRRL